MSSDAPSAHAHARAGNHVFATGVGYAVILAAILLGLFFALVTGGPGIAEGFCKIAPGCTPGLHQSYEAGVPPPSSQMVASMPIAPTSPIDPPQQAARQQCEIAIVRIDDLPPPQGQQLADRIRGRLCSQGGQMTGVEDGHRWTAFRAGQTPPPLCTITNIHIDDMPYPQGQAIADVVHARLCADPSLPLEGTEQGHHWTATRAS